MNIHAIEPAMQQINLKQYDQRFARCGKPIVKVGVNFDAKKGNIEDWEIIISPRTFAKYNH